MGWQRTAYMRQRLEDRIVDGRYAGRPVIKRDSPIDGGVYLGAFQREAIVVDSARDSILVTIYDEAQRRTRDDLGRICKDQILWTVYTIVPEMLPFSESMVDSIIARNGISDDGKIGLGLFVRKKAGVCRHQALLAGFLAERFAKEGYLRGKVSVDRNSSHFDAHGWMRYTSSDGRVYIVDPAQKVFGALTELPTSKRSRYCRDSDIVSRHVQPTK